MFDYLQRSWKTNIMKKTKDKSKTRIMLLMHRQIGFSH